MDRARVRLAFEAGSKKKKKGDQENNNKSDCLCLISSTSKNFVLWQPWKKYEAKAPFVRCQSVRVTRIHTAFARRYQSGRKDKKKVIFLLRRSSMLRVCIVTSSVDTPYATLLND